MSNFRAIERLQVAANTHPFPSERPHPILGSDSKAIHRGKIYCNYKDAVVKKENNSARTTCSWFVRFSFDRCTNDYFIVEVSLDHNHSIKYPMTAVPGGLYQITLDSGLLESELLMIHSLARYNLPSFKVLKSLKSSPPATSFNHSF